MLLLAGAQAFPLVAAILNVAAPFLVIQIPTHCLSQSCLESFFRSPAQLSLNLPGVDGITQVMSRTVSHKCDQVFVARHALRFLWMQFLEQCAYCSHDFYIALLVMPTDVVSLADDTGFQYQTERPGVVFDEQPVADLVALAINGERLAFEGVEDDERNQLFREVVRAVIVGAVRDNGGQAVSAPPGSNQVVGTGLACRIRRAGSVGCGLQEQIFRPLKITVDLVGGNVMEAE